MDAMKLLTTLTLRSPQNSTELTQLGIAELVVQAMKVHSNDDKHQVLCVKQICIPKCRHRLVI